MYVVYNIYPGCEQQKIGQYYANKLFYQNLTNGNKHINKFINENVIYNICSGCERRKIGLKCQYCVNKLLHQNWTSGNKYIDKFIKESQLERDGIFSNIIEWIPYKRLRNIKDLAHGGFSTVYKAIWLDGYITLGNSVKRYRNLLNNEDFEIAKEKDVRSPLNENEKKGLHVALKSLNNSSNVNDDFLNEVSYFIFSKDYVQYLFIKITIYILVEKSFTVCKTRYWINHTHIWYNPRSRNIKLYVSSGISLRRKFKI
jgi:hypothetical protein